MEGLLLNILIYAGLSSSIILITGLFFIFVKENQYRYTILISSIISIFIIYYFHDKFEGLPKNPAVGEYRVQGWEIDETNREIYLLVVNKNNSPINIAIPFDLKNALFLQEAKKSIGIYKKMELVIKENKDNNKQNYTFIFEKRFQEEEKIPAEIVEEENSNEIDISTYPKPN
tara:strand:- start:354 stop:872 length:519 start_codon:yes stop_codon:yes gene_type:complete